MTAVRVVTLTEAELEGLLERAATAAVAKVRPPAEVLDVDGAAELLCCCAKTIRDWAAAGRLPCRRLGGTYRFFRSELLAYLDTLRKAV